MLRFRSLFLLLCLPFVAESLSTKPQDFPQQRGTRTSPSPNIQISDPATGMIRRQRVAPFPSVASLRQRQLQKRRRPLTPPFPNGPCGGTVITIPPEDTFGVDVNLANINFGGDLVMPPRPISVWLPPDYNNKGVRRHPVLYAHDGDNVMEDSKSWTGTSWRLTGALVRCAEHDLLDESMPLPIVVMLPSAPGDLLPGVVRRRHLEYGDVNFPFATAHVDFVAQTVKPLIDNRFATNPSKETTFTIGSSLGGQASLHLLLRHGDLFGGAACLSPAFGPAMIDQVSKATHLRDKKIYLDIGGDLNDIKVPFVDLMDHLTPEHWWNPGYFWLDTQLQGGVAAMRRSLDQVQAPYHYREFPGGRHNERAWAQRIEKPLLHLYGSKRSSSTATSTPVANTRRP